MPTTNVEILNNYNDYLQENNLVQANNAFDFRVGTKVYPIQLDMFLDYLVDQIALQVVGTKSFRDPLDKFYKGDVTLGTVIQDIQTISGYDFNDYNAMDFEKDVANPWKKSKKEVSVYYHNNVIRKKLKQTLSYEQLYSAFKDDYGLNALINSFINDMTVDFYSWEYKTKLALISSNWAKSIKIPYNGYSEFALAVKKITRDFTYNEDSYKYNRAVIPMPIDKEKIAIIISADFADKVDVEYFTGLFNMSLAEIKGRITYINHFPQKNRVCVICDEKGLFFHRVLGKKKQLENPADLTWNIWHHFWRNLDVSENYNAVAIDMLDENEATNDITITVDGVTYEGEQNLAWNKDTTVAFNIADGVTINKVIRNGQTTENPEELPELEMTVSQYEKITIEYTANDIQKTQTYAFRVVAPLTNGEN